MAIPNERLRPFERGTLQKDLVAGLVVFLVALPLCLGIALASGAPLVSGLIAGAIGGIVVGLISGSHTSVSGPAAGLTAIVATQIDRLGTFEAFLTAVVLAGLMQLGLGIAKAGSIASFFPLSVIKGLLAAIGIIPRTPQSRPLSRRRVSTPGRRTVTPTSVVLISSIRKLIRKSPSAVRALRTRRSRRAIASA